LQTISGNLQEQCNFSQMAEYTTQPRSLMEGMTHHLTDSMGLKRLDCPVLSPDSIAAVVDLKRFFLSIDPQHHPIFPVVFGTALDTDDANLLLIHQTAESRDRRMRQDNHNQTN
jgi:hypothetical protein